MFAILAIGFSWLGWLPLTAHALGWTSHVPSPYWHLVGAGGPAAAGIVMCAGQRQLRQLLASCTRAPLRWIVVAVGGPVILFLLAAAALDLLGATINVGSVGTALEYPGFGVAAYALANIIFYGFGEEVGWRGYLLPELQRRFSPLRASLIVVAVWALWHAPLFTFSSGMSTMGVAGIIGWLASLVAGSFLMTALYNWTGGSVVPVALFHGVLDVLINSPTGGPLQSTMGALVTIAGFAAAWRLGPRKPTQPDR